MKRVLLLGDSIRQNYEKIVEGDLSGLAEVLYTNDNNRFSIYMLRYLGEWINALTYNRGDTIDIVHFNCGLWDVVRLKNEDVTLVSVNEYMKYLDRIYQRLVFLCPKAKILAATTTSVIGPGMDQNAGIGIRKNEDIVLFNACIHQLCKKYQMPEPDDLYSFSLEMPMEYRSDYVHFDTDQGRKELGKKVAEYIKDYL